MNLPKDPEIPPQINIVPLIDVVFSLLTFFILSSLFLTNPEGLPVDLPKATSSQPTQVTNRVTITIDSKGQVSLDRQPTTVEALPAQLSALAATRQGLIAVINSDEKVDFGLAVAVMDRVRQVKGVKLAVATRRPA
ncbi:MULTISPECIES: biopolymer transporter ExbD [unclassified Microcoleus]|uniref:biopolymer transporter ExbD n=1 Tax=unclassified Microcoleus TaxID=2642155 RepID=UPI002FD21EC0